MTALLDRIIARSRFPKAVSVEHELRKTGLIRFLFGVIVFIRYSEIVSAQNVLQPELLGAGMMVLVLIAAFTIGLLTPLVNLALMVILHWYDYQSGTPNLGTTMMAQCLLVFFLLNAGSYYSVDNWLGRKQGWLGALIARLYNGPKSDDATSITRVYFLGFFIYAFISFGALLFHIVDETWMEGLTIKMLLTNAYLCSQYDFFRVFDADYPTLFSLLSIAGSIAQSVFQFLMIPLMFFTWGRKFVFWWGLQFFLISLFLINLSMLPHLEILFWVLIFLPVTLQRERVSIIYDDHCNLCKRAMRFFKLINFNDRIHFLAVSTNRNIYEELGLTEKEVKAYMAGTYKGRVLKGYDLYIRVALLNPILWPLLPLFWLGLLFGIGRRIYAAIAENRYKVFGQCELSFEDEIAAATPPLQTKGNKLLTRSIYILLSMIMVVFMLLEFPFISWKVENGLGIKEQTDKLTPWFKGVGLEIPFVFNETDLALGNHWVEHYAYVDGEWKLLPFVGTDGQRLPWHGADYLNFDNHGSDKLYFGTILPIRRKLVITPDPTTLFTDVNGPEFEKVQNLFRFYDQKEGLASGSRVQIRLFKHHGTDVVHWGSNPENYIERPYFETEYRYEDGKLTVISTQGEKELNQE